MNRSLDNCKKGKKGAKNADFRIFLIFLIFGPFLLILNQKTNSKFQNVLKILKIKKIGPKNADFSLF